MRRLDFVLGDRAGLFACSSAKPDRDRANADCRSPRMLLSRSTETRGRSVEKSMDSGIGTEGKKDGLDWPPPQPRAFARARSSDSPLSPRASFLSSSRLPRTLPERRCRTRASQRAPATWSILGIVRLRPLCTTGVQALEGEKISKSQGRGPPPDTARPGGDAAGARAPRRASIDASYDPAR